LEICIGYLGLFISSKTGVLETLFLGGSNYGRLEYFEAKKWEDFLEMKSLPLLVGKGVICMIFLSSWA
jgi:hypothetical protein